VSTPPNWAGDERRSIPVHLINYIDEKLAEHTAAVEELMTRRYDEILASQERAEGHMEKRHTELIKSLQSYATKAERVHENLGDAFLVNKKGQPDFSGHANAHEAWVKEAEESRKMRTFVKQIVVGAAVSTVGSWVILLMWKGLLLGPTS
jgi:hypothetical protein